MNFKIFKLVLEKAGEPEIKLPASAGYRKSKGIPTVTDFIFFGSKITVDSDCTQSLQWCPVLCDPIDHTLPGSFIHGILRARILQWVTIPFSRGSSQPMGQSQVSCICRQILYQLSYQGSPRLASSL